VVDVDPHDVRGDRRRAGKLHGHRARLLHDVQGGQQHARRDHEGAPAARRFPVAVLREHERNGRRRPGNEVDEGLRAAPIGNTAGRQPAHRREGEPPPHLRLLRPPRSRDDEFASRAADS
jgi:hypothetical protein